MIKKFVLFALLLVPALGYAQQAQLIAYVNFGEIIPLMPEYAQMMDSLEKEQKVYAAEIQDMQTEYSKKYEDFLDKQETLAESIKAKRLQEIEDYRQRTLNYQQQAQQNLEQLNNTILASIVEKLNKILEQIGTENHYAYILDAQALRFISPQSPNATPLVKAKLGLK
jgi:outer membrane protein